MQKFFAILAQVVGIYFIVQSFSFVSARIVAFLLDCSIYYVSSPGCLLLGMNINEEMYRFSQETILSSLGTFIFGALVFSIGLFWLRKINRKNSTTLPRWYSGVQVIIGGGLFLSIVGTIVVNSHTVSGFLMWLRHVTAYLLVSDIGLVFGSWLLFRGFRGFNDTPITEVKKERKKEIAIYIVTACALGALILWTSIVPIEQLPQTDRLNYGTDEYSFGSSDYIKDAVPMKSIPVDQYVPIATERLEQYKKSQNPWGDEHKDEEFLKEMKTQTDVVDRSSFEVFTTESRIEYTGFGKDKNHFYYNSQIIDGVTPDKFKLVKTGSYKEYSSTYSDLFFFVSKDEIYLYGETRSRVQDAKKIEGADVETFHIIGSYWGERSVFHAIDKSRVYFNTKLIESLNPDQISLTFSTSSNSFAQKAIEFIIDQNTGDKYLRGVNISEQLRQLPQQDEMVGKDELNFLTADDIFAATSSNGRLVVKRYDFEGSDYGDKLGIFDATTNTLLRQAEAKPMLGGYGVLGFSPDQTQVYFFEGCYEGLCASELYRLDVNTGSVQLVPGFLGLAPYSVRKSVVSSDQTKIALTDFGQDAQSSSCYNDGGRDDTVVKVLDLAGGQIETVFETNEPIVIVDLEISPDERRLNIIYDVYLLTEDVSEFESTHYEVHTSRERCADTLMSSHNGDRYFVQSIDNPFK